MGEFFTNPVGYSLEDLSFSWKIPAQNDKNGVERKNIRQSAYEIAVAKSPEELSTNLLWNSGRVDSDKSVKVAYKGPSVSSRERLYWKVRYWDENNAVSEWSDVSFFEAGLLDNSDWKGKWIFASELRTKLTRKIDRPAWKSKFFSDYISPAYFRKEIGIGKKIKSARFYVTVRGLF